MDSPDSFRPDISETTLLLSNAGTPGHAKRTSGASPTDGAWYTVDEAVEALGMGRFQALVLSIAGLCWISDAMQMLLLSFVKGPEQCAWGISDAQAALVTGSTGAGMLCGALFWGTQADRRGRRSAFCAATALTLVAGLLASAAPGYAVMLGAQAAVGFGIGGVPIAFSLIMEFLPARDRGRWAVSLALFWSLGAMLEALLAMLVVPAFGFRALIAASALPLAALLALASQLPESPRWLVTRGRTADAAAVLERMARVNGKSLPPGTLRAPPPVPATAPDEPESAQFAALLRPGRRGLTLGVWTLWFAASFAFFGGVMLQPDLLAAENAGLRCNYAAEKCAPLRTAGKCMMVQSCAWLAPGTSSGAGSCVASGSRQARMARQRGVLEPPKCHGTLSRADYLNALFASTGEVPGMLVVFFAVDVIGRRPLVGYLFVLWGGIVLLLTSCPGRMVETILFFLMRGCGNGFYQTMYVYTSELEPTELRGTATGVASAFGNLGLIFTPLVAQYLDNLNFLLAMAIYSAVCFVAYAAVRLLPIETARRPLFSTSDELIHALRKKPCRDINRPTFGNDPAAHPIVRLFRWNAEIDGLALDDAETKGGKLEA